jgi:hypothetical protein
MLNPVALAASVGQTITPDAHGHLTPECLDAATRKRIEDAATATDTATGSKTKKKHKQWEKLAKIIDKYFVKLVNGDIGDLARHYKRLRPAAESYLQDLEGRLTRWRKANPLPAAP